MAILRTDGFDIYPNTATAAYDGGAQFIQAWCDATVAIVAGDWMAVDVVSVTNPGGILGQTYIAADATGATDNSNFDVIGVAMQSLASGTGMLMIQVSGRNLIANVDAAVDAGDILCVGTTKGQAIEQVFDASTTANRRSIGRAVTAASSNVSTVDIYRHPILAGP